MQNIDSKIKHHLKDQRVNFESKQHLCNTCTACCAFFYEMDKLLQTSLTIYFSFYFFYDKVGWLCKQTYKNSCHQYTTKNFKTYVCTYINKFNFKIVDGKFNKNRSLFFVKLVHDLSNLEMTHYWCLSVYPFKSMSLRSLLYSSNDQEIRRRV